MDHETQQVTNTVVVVAGIPGSGKTTLAPPWPENLASPSSRRTRSKKRCSTPSALVISNGHSSLATRPTG